MSNWFIFKKHYLKHYSKARKRDREVNETERKLYLQDPLLELRIPENEINFLTDLPGGLDYNEWLASHSEYREIIVHKIWMSKKTIVSLLTIKTLIFLQQLDFLNI